MRLAAAQFCLQRRSCTNRYPAASGYIVHLKGEEFVINHAFAKAYPAYPSLIGFFLVHILWEKKKQLIFGDVCPHGRFHDEIHESPRILPPIPIDRR